MSEMKPAVTREQYEAGRAVLDALPPGYYVKCGGPCKGWYMDGEFVKDTVSHFVPWCRPCYDSRPKVGPKNKVVMPPKASDPNPDFEPLNFDKVEFDAALDNWTLQEQQRPVL